MLGKLFRNLFESQPRHTTPDDEQIDCPFCHHDRGFHSYKCLKSIRREFQDEHGVWRISTSQCKCDVRYDEVTLNVEKRTKNAA